MRLKGTHSSSLVLLASAFALPPKIINLDWSIPRRAEMKVFEKRAQSVELLNRSHLESISNEAKAEGRFQFREGIFQAEGKQLAFINPEDKSRNLWSIPLGFEPLRWEKTNARTGLIAWDIYPSQIFFLDWGDKKSGAKALGYKISWSEDSEILRFFECHYGRWVLVENLPNGLTRLYFVEKGSEASLVLKSYTIFDFSPKASSSEVLRVENEGCHTFWFYGSFGKVRVRY